MNTASLKIRIETEKVRYLDTDGEEQLGVRGVGRWAGREVFEVLMDLAGERVEDALAIRGGW